MKEGKQSPEQRAYAQWISQREPKPPRLRNCGLAFLIGGLVCVFGELVTDFWEATLKISHQEAADHTITTLIALSALLTGLGLFDKVARYAGAGLSVPVTGFANALTCSALEFKREGPILGIGGRMFQLAGPVLTYGVVTVFFVGLIKAIAKLLF